MKIYTIGGYNEVGRNMTAVEVRDDIVILDMGYHMEELIGADQEVEELSTGAAQAYNIIPNDSVIYSQREKVKGIVIGHGHKDHLGAIPKMANSYDCPILASPYTMKIVEEQIISDHKAVSNDRYILNPGEIYNLSSSIAVEFVSITHSIPHSMLTVLHTREGRLLYGLDFRLDNYPVLGDKPDYARLEELGREGVKVLIGDSTRITEPGTGNSETTVKNELEVKLDRLMKEAGAIIITTFSSHIERLKSILEVNDRRRKVAFIGHSLKEYTRPAEELGLIDLSGIEIASYRDEVDVLFEKISSARSEWLITCTGNQGEARSVLKKLSADKFPLKIGSEDSVIFSSTTIPTPVNRAERYTVERALKKKGARLHLDLHASGHAHREDLRLLLRMIMPDIMIPAHGDIHMLAAHADLAREEGYMLNDNLFICENGNVLEL